MEQRVRGNVTQYICDGQIILICEEEIEGKKALVKLIGEVLADVVSMVASKLNALIDAGCSLELDMSALICIQPSMLEQLLHLIVKAEDKKQSVRIAWVSQAVYDQIKNSEFMSQILDWNREVKRVEGVDKLLKNAVIIDEEQGTAQERIAEEQREKEEQERIAKEKREKEEQERIAKEKREKEEQERIAKEKREKEEQERIAKEQREKEEQERIAKEQREKEEQERIAKEQREKEEQARIAKEQREKEEQARIAQAQRKKEEQERGKIKGYDDLPVTVDNLGVPNTTKLDANTNTPVLIHLSDGRLYIGQAYKTTIGRAPTCDICLEDMMTVSRAHAHLIYENSKNYIVADENATNPAKLNGVKLVPREPCEIENYAQIELADELFLAAFGAKADALKKSASLNYLKCLNTGEIRIIDGEEFMLGRLYPWPSGSMNNGSISRKHARIYIQEGAWMIAHLSTKTKTMVNDTIVDWEHAFPLCDGDVITLGPQHMQYEFRSIKLKKQR